jgi:hypothetical protein
MLVEDGRRLERETLSDFPENLSESGNITGHMTELPLYSLTATSLRTPLPSSSNS